MKHPPTKLVSISSPAALKYARLPISGQILTTDFDSFQI